MSESETYIECACPHCRGRIEFPAQGIGETIPCPLCGQPILLAIPERPSTGGKRAALWISVAVVVVALGAGGWFFLAARKAPPVPVKVVIQAPPPPPVVVPVPPPEQELLPGIKSGQVTFQKADEGGLVFAVGVLHNESGKQRFGVKVHIDLFDDKNKKVASTTDYVQLIDPGKEWKFKAIVTDKNATRAELVKITEQ